MGCQQIGLNGPVLNSRPATESVIMQTQLEASQHADSHHDRDQGHCEAVSIYVNNEPVYIQPGRYAVATLKKLAGVPLADDIDQLVNSTLKPVADDATLVLHGCEIFVSHIKDGGAS